MAAAGFSHPAAPGPPVCPVPAARPAFLGAAVTFAAAGRWTRQPRGRRRERRRQSGRAVRLALAAAAARCRLLLQGLAGRGHHPRQPGRFAAPPAVRSGRRPARRRRCWRLQVHSGCECASARLTVDHVLCPWALYPRSSLRVFNQRLPTAGAGRSRVDCVRTAGAVRPDDCRRDRRRPPEPTTGSWRRAGCWVAAGPPAGGAGCQESCGGGGERGRRRRRTQAGAVGWRRHGQGRVRRGRQVGSCHVEALCNNGEPALSSASTMRF
eukprot:SAG22_NODE_807_length_7081_cov_2.460756_3_plen_267_part_00